MLGHLLRMAKSSPTLLWRDPATGRALLGGRTGRPAIQADAERIVRGPGLSIRWVGLSKCPDHVVNKGMNSAPISAIPTERR